jgi:hypothetical protein
MSNYLAIATVTATLKKILEDIGSDVPGAIVTAQPPDTIVSPSQDELNLFLYHVKPNNGYSNFDLPARNPDGQLVNRPLLGLDLHYLITAYASNSNDMQAHKIVASAMRILHEKPILTRDVIRATISAQSDLVNSDLADQLELIKLTHEPLSLEDITKLWSSFFQTHYRISIAYQATVVLLESKQEPKPTLPVQERLVYTLPFKQPVIDRVEPQIIERTANARLIIIGRNLRSDRVAVQFGDLDPEIPQSNNIADGQISIPVPQELRAGIRPVRVIHQLMLGSQEVEHRGFESNIVAFVLAPRITKINNVDISIASLVRVNRNTDLVIEFEPSVTLEQKVAILVGNHSFSVPQRDLTSAPAKELSIRIPANFSTGIFLVRLRIDGAESLLRYENNEFVGPKIEVT